MPYRVMLKVLACLALILASVGAPAQNLGADPVRDAEAANREEILDVLEDLVASLTDKGLTPFPAISYPFLVIKGGDEPGMAVFQSAAELGKGGEAILILSDAEIHLLGNAAFVEFVYGPAEEPRARAVAFAVFTRPADTWMAKVLALAPAAPLAAPTQEDPNPDEAIRPLSDRDVVSALLGTYVKMLTTTGPQEFSGLQAPFIYLDGATATMVVYGRSADFPPRGEPLALDPRNIRASVLPGIAMARATLYGEAEYSNLCLLCVRGGEGWRALLACAGPLFPIEELEPAGSAEDAR